jgi:hypothetical protein
MSLSLIGSLSCAFDAARTQVETAAMSKIITATWLLACMLWELLVQLFVSGAR